MHHVISLCFVVVFMSFSIHCICQEVPSIKSAELETDIENFRIQYANGISSKNPNEDELFQYFNRKFSGADNDKNGTISADEIIAIYDHHSTAKEYIFEIGAVLKRKERYLQILADQGKTEILKKISSDDEMPSYLRDSAGKYIFENESFQFQSNNWPQDVSDWLKHGGNPNSLDRLNGTAIEYVIKTSTDFSPQGKINDFNEKIIKCIELIIDAGGNVNLTNELGESPLIIAAIAENIDVLKFLLKKGANANKRTLLGWNAYDILKYKNNDMGLKSFESVDVDKSGPKELHLPWYIRYVPYEYESLRKYKKMLLVDEYFLNYWGPRGNSFNDYQSKPSTDGKSYFFQMTNFGGYLEGAALISLFSYDKKEIHVEGTYGQYMLDNSKSPKYVFGPERKDKFDYFKNPTASDEVRETFRKNLKIEYGKLVDVEIEMAIVKHPKSARIYRIPKESWIKINDSLKSNFKENVVISAPTMYSKMQENFREVLKGALNQIGPNTIMEEMHTGFFHELVDNSYVNESSIAPTIYFPFNSLAYLEELTDLKPEELDFRGTKFDEISETTIKYKLRKVHLSSYTTVSPYRYEGAMINNSPQGKGTLYLSETEKIIGFFDQGLPTGKYFKFRGDVLVESGTYLKGKRDGVIISYYESFHMNSISKQETFANDLLSDGPFIINDMNFDNGLLRRTYVGEMKNGIRSGTWKDVVNIRNRNHHNILVLLDELFKPASPDAEQYRDWINIYALLTDAKIVIADNSSDHIIYYADPKADVSIPALTKIMSANLVKYIPKLSLLLTRYQAEYRDTVVTSGSKGYVIFPGRAVRYSDYDFEKDTFMGHAITVFLDGDSFEGELKKDGSTFEGTLTYRNSKDNTTLVGQFDPESGFITGPATFTFFDKTIGKNVTQNVNVGVKGFSYVTEAQRQYNDNGRGFKKAWKGIFHDGDILKKLEHTFHLFRDGLIHPFLFIMVEYEIDKLGVSWSDKDGVGLIVGKRGVGEINLTASDIEEFSVPFSTQDDKKTMGLALKFDNTSIPSEQAKKISYAVKNRNISKKIAPDGRSAGQTTISPVIAEKNTFYSDISGLRPTETYDILYNQQILDMYKWTPEQRKEITESFNYSIWTEQEIVNLNKQLETELISTQVEHFLKLPAAYKVPQFNAMIMAECISWTIQRVRDNELKPEYKLRLHALLYLMKSIYDDAFWIDLNRKAKSGDLSDRHEAIIYQATEALDEFDKLIKSNQIDREKYLIPESNSLLY